MQQKVKTTFRHWALSTLILLLAACTKESDISPAEPTLSDKIKVLEHSGVIPKLDRSADIKGPDQNLNGVRDDIDAWIAGLPITDKQRKAVIQEAQSMQKMPLVDLYKW